MPFGGTVRRAVLLFAAVIVVLAGCTRPVPAEQAEPSGPATSEPAIVPDESGPPPPPIATRTPSPPGFDEFVAVPCGGRPNADQVLAAVRRGSDLLPRSLRAAVTTGPLCAGTWQYTVISVSGREPLQVVTKGAPTSLTLVTAGTDVCTVTVRTSAPTGIMTVAHCPPTG
jgi:hypothetical protein